MSIVKGSSMRLIAPVVTNRLAIVKIPGATQLFEASAARERVRLGGARATYAIALLPPLYFTVLHPQTGKPTRVPIQMISNWYQSRDQFDLDEGKLNGDRVAVRFSFNKNPETGHHGYITDASK